MVFVVASLVVAAASVSPAAAVIVHPHTGAPLLEQGVLSGPLTGEPVSAVRSWALQQGERYPLGAGGSLVSTQSFATRFGASFHLQHVVNGLEVLDSKLVVTLDSKKRVVQVASSLVPFTRALTGENLTLEQALQRGAKGLQLVALRPDGVPYGGGKRFFFEVGTELHAGWLLNVQTYDVRQNLYVALDAVTGATLFVQNRVHHQNLEANVYALSPGGLDAGVGLTPTVTRQLQHADGGTMIAGACQRVLADGGVEAFANDAGELCGTQLTMYNCCPSAGCAPDAGPARAQGNTTIQLFGFDVPVAFNVAVCDRLRIASNVRNPGGSYVYAPVDPPTDKVTVRTDDAANSDAFAEVHSFFHVNQVYDWVRGLSAKGPAIFNGTPAITPFMMRDERRTPAVRVAVWSNVMFPDFQKLLDTSSGACMQVGLSLNCKSDTLVRIDNAAFLPRENFAQIPVPGFDTGADTLMIFQGNAADAAYDATVIQHEFGHGVVYATAGLRFDTAAIDSRSANNEGGALHEGFADYIAAAFNGEDEIGPYFGPRAFASAGGAPGVRPDGYLRKMSNTERCPNVLWGEVHQDSQHVAGALWDGRKAFLGTDNGATYDAAFYAMLVSISPNADFEMVANAMADRVATAFPGTATARAQMTQFFMNRGVIGCSKILEVTTSTVTRPYFGIAQAPSTIQASMIPGPFQVKLNGAAGVARVQVTATIQAGAAALGGAPVLPSLLVKSGAPITFTKQGARLNNDAQVSAALTGTTTLSGSATINSPCNTDVYATLAAPDGGSTLSGLTLSVVPLTNCMLPVDAGTGGGAGGGTGTGGGAGGGGAGGGAGSTGGGAAGTGGGVADAGSSSVPSVGAGGVNEQPQAQTGCGCSNVDAMAMLLVGLGLLRRRAR